MKINVAKPIRDYKGDAVTRVVEGKTEDYLIRSAISGAINSESKVKPMTAEDKAKAYQLSVKVWAKKEVNLTVDEMAFIKKKAGEVYGPLTYGRLCDLFDKPEKTDENPNPELENTDEYLLEMSNEQ